MALEGNLKDFAATEILQLLGTQKKTGCLMLEHPSERANFYVQEGRLVSSRQPGLTKDDPLLRFLVRVHRLSNEQYRGILTIQRESSRDLEDLLVNGRYLDAEELGALIERQILDDLMHVMSWESGSYRFDPHNRWPNPPLARLSVEGALIEGARRADEQRRFVKLTQDPLQLLGVRDLPNADEHLSEEECELFGIIDGRHTLAEIVDSAPLTEYEAYEALQRMLESGWVEVTGRRDAGSPIPPAGTEEQGAGLAGSAAGSRIPAWSGQVVVGIGALVLLLAFSLAARSLRVPDRIDPAKDIFAAAQLRDVRYAVDLYHRESGRYPENLEILVADRWVRPDQVKVQGRPMRYVRNEGRPYTLALPAGS